MKKSFSLKIAMKENISKISVLVNVILTGTKITVGAVSHSSSVLAEGIHSFMDIFSSAIVYLGIRTSKKPADEKHPYGHFKFEVLSGLIITLILLVTGGVIIYGAYQKLSSPVKIEFEHLGIAVMLFSAVVNEIMARIKINFGKKENSISLISDGLHSRIDVFTSLAVVVCLIITKYWAFADSVLAFLIGIYIIQKSISLGKDAVGSLLDVSAGTEVEEKIQAIVKDQKIEMDSLKTQKKGSAFTANLEIKLPSDLKIEEATKISDGLRKILMEKFNDLFYVSIQIKSHDLETGFYLPAFGKSIGWQNLGKFKEKYEKAEGRGPHGRCICSGCGYEIPHQRGIPCASIQCPNCNVNLERK